jgi:hypothetical protein
MKLEPQTDEIEVALQSRILDDVLSHTFDKHQRLRKPSAHYPLRSMGG